MRIFEQYIKPHHHYFWEWVDGGEAIAIPNGSTIAYFQHVRDILLTFKKRNVPHLGSLLLVLVAMNDSLADDIKVLTNHIQNLLDNEPTDTSTSQSILQDSIKLLRSLESLPKDYKTGRNKVLVIHTLFNQIHNPLSIKESIQVIDSLSKNEQVILDYQLLIAKNSSFPFPVFTKDFRTLALLGKHFSSAEQIIKKTNDLQDIPEIDLQEVEKNTGEKTIIDLLIENPKTFQVGSLIDRIWSGMNIPYKMNTPSGQPLGGISDITNKGDFDKLLISEFANDDLVFLSRLANQESLYLRREKPPASDQFERIILIDISIKNWGIPKIIAFSVMAAIANHPKTNVHCSAYAIGNSLISLNPYDAKQIENDLMYVDIALNASKGLEEFLIDKKPNSNTEILYISNLESTQFPQMSKILNDYHSLFKYWINIERNGIIKIFKNQFKSKRLIQSITLPLNQLWKNPPKEDVMSLPSKQTIFPILCPNASISIRQFTIHENQTYQLVKGAGILASIEKRNQKGFKLIFDVKDFYKNQKFEIGQLDNGDVILLNFIPSDRRIRFFNLTNQTHESTHFDQWKHSYHPEFFFYNNSFNYLNHDGQRTEISFSEKWEIKSTKEKNFKKWKLIYEGTQKKVIDPRYSYTGTTLKNVKTIIINENKNLCFNGHELSLDLKDDLYLLVNTPKKKINSATKTANSLFTFNDSSTIEINSAGMFIFKSANPEISTFYIPSLLQEKLAIATEREFAGNSYFYIEETQNAKTSLILLYNHLITPFINHIQSHEDSN